MSTINNIFSSDGVIYSKDNRQKISYNREHLINKKVAEELNTYLNFGIFPVNADTTPAIYDEANDLKRTDESSVSGTPGVRSIFNRAGAVLLGSNDGSYQVDIADGEQAHAWRIMNNVPLMDSPKARQRIRQTSGCSIKELVEASQCGAMGQATYAYSDFMYCKHVGRVSNNYMITLRRFPLPVDDFIGAQGEAMVDRLKYPAKHASCIGCMVTWMGVSGNDLGSILKYSYNMPFKEENAERQKSQDADQNASMLSGMFSVFDKSYRQQYQAGNVGEAANKGFEAFGIKTDNIGNGPYKENMNFEDNQKVYGPVDTIQSTYRRADGGLTYAQSFTLTFEYELKSYNGINGKQAMLDLISNILNVTYTTGSFWGGGYKGFGAHQSNVFANLNIFKARGGFTNFVDALADDISNLGKSAASSLGFVGPDGKFSLKNGLKGLMQELNSIGGMLMSGMLNKFGRPQKQMYNSLLSPAPIGFWHVTIGNPKRPIMSIGNMVITGCEIEHQGPLGLDDFPTGLKVSVTLNRGKPRDLRDIEKLYMQGTDRIYTSMGDKVFDMYKNSELYKANRIGNTVSEAYKPVTKIATVDTDGTNTTVTVEQWDKLNASMKKYFGTTDAYAIYVPAAEQECGAGKKKPSTSANKNLVGGDGNTAKTGGHYAGGK